MSDRKPVCLVVGDAGRPDTLSRKYEPDAEKFLEKCRRIANKHSRIWTNDPRVVIAFQALHRLGELEVIIQRVYDGVKEYHLDIKGDLIEPWPDEFFELSFYLRFNDF